jgi:hypothetical protein
VKLNFSKGLTVMLIPGLISCAAINVVNTEPVKNSSTDNPEQINIVRLKNEGVIPRNAETVYVADVGNGKKGASFSIQIQFPDNNSQFNAKANTSGNLAKTAADIQTFEVYLIKHSVTLSSDPYPLFGDPLSDLASTKFTLTNTGAVGIAMIFTNVGDSNGNAYYAAVRAKDSGGIDLIKVNDGRTTAGQLWTGSTTNGQIAVSTGAGIIVNSSLVATPTTALVVAPNLLDAAGATVQALIAPNSGNPVLPNISGS